MWWGKKCILPCFTYSCFPSDPPDRVTLSIRPAGNVVDHPVNISISLNQAHVVWGSSVNLTCSSTAATDYTWYRRTDSNGSSGLQVGSGQVLSISSMEVSHSGFYLCQARNQLGEKNSTEVLLAIVEEEEQGL